MAAEIDEQHRESMRTIDDDLGELHFGTDPALAASRRRFLTRAAAGGAIAFGATAIPVATMMPSALAQTTGSAVPTAKTGAVPTAGAAGTVPPGSAVAPTRSTKDPLITGLDLSLAAFVQTVELAGVQMYKRMVDGGRLTSPVAHTANEFALHHGDHATALGTYLNKAAIGTANQALLDSVLPKITAAELNPNKAEANLAQVAYDFESGMAATYAWAMGQFDQWEIAGLGATIEPVEAQQALAWSLVIEPDPEIWKNQITTWIPNFQNDDGAFKPSEFAV